MSGETDLPTLLAELRPALLAEAFAFVSLPANHALFASAQATVREGEGLSAVVTAEQARAANLPFDGRFRWITLRVHSSLEAVGLTAAVATRLAKAGIPANVIAGKKHDHVLVPEGREGEAIRLLETTQS